jgi:hypothetical protein
MGAMVVRLFTRNNVVWTITLIGSVLAFVAASTSLVPADYVNRVKDVAMVCGFVAAKLSTSPLPHSADLEQSS